VQIDHTAGPHKGRQVRLAYDGEHRLLASERIQTNTDGQRHSVLTRYHYDPMSRRVGKQHLKRVSQGDGQKTEWRIQSSLWFGWDGDRMVTMQNERQASTTVYEPNSFVPMLRVDKQLQSDERRAKGEMRTYHIHCNYLGTPEALIDQNDLQLVWQIELDPWGQTQRECNPNNMLQPIRMQGQQLDAETGLFYNRYRYYDPAGGRYVTQDPIGLLGGSNSYEYAYNLPTIAYDPTGLLVPLVVLGVVKAAAIGSAIGAGVEIGSQIGKQVVGQVMDTLPSLDKAMDIVHGRSDDPLFKVNTDCINVDWGQVGVSAGVGAVAPGMFSAAKTIYASGSAIQTIGSQAANTANRAAKNAARIGEHKKIIKEQVATQSAIQSGKTLGKCAVAEEKKACK
jgi:RHS repeat-associated protein